MGCCLSRNDDDSSKKNPPLPLVVSDADISRLPPLLEEETVKEVLSETPSLKKPPSFRKVEEKEEQKIHLPAMLLLPTFPKKEEPQKRIVEKEAPFIATQEISEMSSEICSLSESYSTTTVTERNREDDDERSSYGGGGGGGGGGEVRQRVIDRSPTKAPRRRSNRSEYGGVPDRGRKSPARRSEPSPGRRNDSNALKSVNSTEVFTGKRRMPGNHSNNRNWRDPGEHNNNNRNWRDPGECSGRRSRSPSTRTDSGNVMKPGIARSPSARKTGRSPSRIPSFAPESSRRLIGETKEEDNAPTNESLENPLVSLECFIFL